MNFGLVSQKQIKPTTTLVIAAFSLNDFERHPLVKLLSATDRNFLVSELNSFKWGDKDAVIHGLPSQPGRKLIVLGLGDKNKWQRRKMFLAARRVVTMLKNCRLDSAAINLDDFAVRGVAPDELISLAIQNMLMADFAFVIYKERPKDGWPEIKNIQIVCRSNKKMELALKEGVVIGTEVNECRRLANTPGGIMTPAKLAQEAVTVGKRTPAIKVKILDAKKIKELGMGGVIGVAQGSVEKPKFIIMEYGPALRLRSGQARPIVFVGKGVTFDTGGINLKPGESSYEMHMDMSGGAAVIHAVEAIAKLRLPVRVVGLIPAVENMPSGSSYRPGDILKSITGKTIEVLNTDAEGRVILADALGYAQGYNPSLVVDVATLTGAAMRALGQRMSALFANQDRLLKIGQQIGDQTGDFVWPMPLWEEHDEEIQGTFGDVANAHKTPYGGAILGAAFLKQFVGDFPWIHLDIAPTMTTIDGQYLAKGAAGASVRFLVELAKRWK